MNETVLALMSALAIYGLSSLAMSCPEGSTDDLHDLHDLQISDAESAPTANPEGESLPEA